MKRVSDLGGEALARLFKTAGLDFVCVDSSIPIPGSYWGNPEAGLIGPTLFAASTTPIHSALHEAGHFVVMPKARRQRLHTDAGGDDAEEAAVCVVQVWLAANLVDYSEAMLFADMDAWGYSFREEAAARWWCGDAQDARRWLLSGPRARHLPLPLTEWLTLEVTGEPIGDARVPLEAT